MRTRTGDVTAGELEAFERRTGIGKGDYDLLAQTPLFAGLARDSVKALLADSAMHRFERAAVLFVQGEAATRFYIIFEGWVKLFRATRDGHESVIGVFTSGESFAEAAMFASGVFPVSAVVVDDARLLVVPADKFIRRLREDPALSLMILASMSRHLRQLVMQVEQLNTRSTTERLATFLLKLCANDKGPATVRLPMDKALIAGRLGMQPETLSRTFAKLREYGVQTKGAEMIIPDVAALRRLAEGDQFEGPPCGPTSG